MIILKGIEIVDLALYFGSTLVIADVHIGYEEALNKQGVLVPRLQLEEIVKRMNGIFNVLKGKKIDRIIVNGDLKHEFGAISEQEWRNTLKFLDLLAKHCDEIILVKGNHDTILGPIARKRNVEVVGHYLITPLIKKTLKNEKTIIYIMSLESCESWPIFYIEFIAGCIIISSIIYTLYGDSKRFNSWI